MKKVLGILMSMKRYERKGTGGNFQVVGTL